MGQIFSVRKKFKETKVSESDVQTVRIGGGGNYSDEKKKKQINGGYVRQRKKRSNSDLLFICPPITANNSSFQSPLMDVGYKRNVTRTTEANNISSLSNLLTKKDANNSNNSNVANIDGGVFVQDITYSNGRVAGGGVVGHNYLSQPKSSLRTCKPQNNNNYYLDSKSIYSEPTVQSEPPRRHHHNYHHHRHHRRKKSRSIHSNNHNHHQQTHFGYDIKNVDEFLSKCSLASPGNIPVVLSSASILYQTRPGYQRQIQVPLGMVVNAVFKIQQWVYVQTPHADEEGYLMYDVCLPMGILPANRPPTVRSERCWETSEDIYPKPGGVGLWTDSEKECRLRNTRSEGARTPPSSCNEKNVDSLYMRAAASQSKLNGIYSVIKSSPKQFENTERETQSAQLIRETLLAVQMNYKSSAISVKKGDVVTLLSCKEIRDSNSKTPRQWFYVRTRQRAEAFIPAEVAGHGFL